MEGFVILDTENRVATGNKPCTGKAMKASSGKATRTMLADISNFPQKTRALEQDGKSQYMPITAKEYIDQLRDENIALTKIVAERNKLIEVTEIELKKLRLNQHKMQQQNLELAQSNSQLLADLNSGKDRLKALQHELGCQKVLLKVKNKKVQLDCVEAKESKIGVNDETLRNFKRRPQSKRIDSSLQVQSTGTNENKRPCFERQSARFENEELKHADVLVPVCRQADDALQENVSTSAEDDAHGDEVKNKRPCGIRQSAKDKFEEPNPSEDSFEMQDPKSCVYTLSDDDKVEENGLSSTCSLKNEETEGIPPNVYEAQECRRSSLCRPLRQAAKKVQTYKEIPLNVKMHRPE